MRVFSLRDVPRLAPQAVALGYFDGGHIGHERILRAASDACGEGMESAVFSFPALPTKSGAPLLSLDDRLAFFEKTGIQNVILAPFEEVCDLSAEAFVQEILKDRLSARMALCGFNYRFGKGALGNTQLLSRILPESLIFPPTLYAGEAVSATRIRTALLAGNMKDATHMLGRPYTVKGEVIHGNARGRTLGFPTANIVPDVLLPCFGVYQTEVRFDGNCYAGLSDVGVRPTVANDTVARVETFLTDFSGDLYGKRIEISFLRFLRAEKKFSSADELKEQIALDLKQI